MSIRVNAIGIAVLSVLAFFASAASTSVQDNSAYDLVQNTTEQVMDVVMAADEYVDARNVMGPYASSKRYRSLDESGREQLKSQLDRFTAVMRSSLVRTYSKGLLAFGGSRIELVRPETGENDEAVDSRLSVRQLIYADRAQPYELMYQMGREKSGGWKLRNVIIEDVNLGEIYRDQFLTSAREQDGNLEAVIDTWTVVIVDVDE